MGIWIVNRMMALQNFSYWTRKIPLSMTPNGFQINRNDRT